MITSSLRTAALLALAATLATGAATPPGAPPGDDARWSADLAAAERSGVRVDPDGVRLDPAGVPSEAGAERLGLLTLAPHTLDSFTDRVTAAVTADVPQGSTAGLDVRALRADGDWTEWLPADPAGGVTLPEPTTQVQGRLVLSGPAGASPVVHSVALAARPVQRPRVALDAPPMLGYRVFATREGLVGGTTANGHVIDAEDHFVALPSRRSLAPQDSGDYTVRVCAPAIAGRPKRCGYAPVWDVGPWNTRDDYWNPGTVREQWQGLPQGVPQAQMAHLDGFNDGRDEFDREVLNPAGVDLSDALFRDLGMTDNGWVQVDYLWTGSEPMATARERDDPVTVRAAADEAAGDVGIAASHARMPARCLAAGPGGPWLKIADGQFVPADAVTWRVRPPVCGSGPLSDLAAPGDHPDEHRRGEQDAAGT